MAISTKIIEVFTVKRKKFLTPHCIRITFSIPEKLIAQLNNLIEGSNNKLFIPPKGTNVVYFPNKQNIHLKEELVAIVRTYTNRKIDLQNQELTIDFVLHKNYGPGSNWALYSKVGNAIGIGLKTGIKSLVPLSNNYLLIGDHTALPVISTILEHLPQGVNVDVLLEVFGLEDELQINSAVNIEIIWLHNQNPEKGSLLAEKAKSILKDKNKFETYVYVAAEHSIVNKLKNYLKNELLWENTKYSAVSHWEANESEK